MGGGSRGERGRELRFCLGIFVVCQILAHCRNVWCWRGRTRHRVLWLWYLVASSESFFLFVKKISDFLSSEKFSSKMFGVETFGVGGALCLMALVPSSLIWFFHFHP